MRALILAVVCFCLSVQGQVNRANIIKAVAEKQKPTSGGGGGGGGDITTGLIAWWKFDEGSGTTTADSSGNGSTGTFNGASGFTSSSQVGAFAGNFPGSSGDGVSFTGVDFHSVDTGTYAGWVYLTSYNGGAFENVMTQGGAVGIWIETGHVNYYFGSSHESTSVIPLNTWTHIAVTFNAGDLVIYINGVSDASFAGVANLATPTCMGADNGTGGEQLFGRLDDMRVYNRTLSPTDIATLYSYR